MPALPGHRGDLLFVGVCRLPEAVAYEIEGQDGDDYEDAGNEQPRMMRHRAKVLRVLQLRAPAHCRRLEPKPEKAECCLANDHFRYGECQVHDQVAEERGKKMPADDAAAGGS